MRGPRTFGSPPPMSSHHHNLEPLGRWHATIYWSVPKGGGSLNDLQASQTCVVTRPPDTELLVASRVWIHNTEGPSALPATVILAYQ